MSVFAIVILSVIGSLFKVRTSFGAVVEQQHNARKLHTRAGRDY
jgi:hypothetical protein